MQIYSNQLANNLSQLSQCYLVFGDEPLQKQEALKAIRQACAKQGFDERIILDQQPGFSWNELYQAGQSMSLFSTKQLIELELSTLKPGQEGSKALVQFISNISPDIILLIHGPKAPQDVQKSKWFKTLAQAGLFVIVSQPQGHQFNQWVKQRAQQRHINFTADAMAQFSQMFEGNLLAADQELEKLALQLGSQLIDAASLKQRVSNQARYNLFELQDAIMLGDQVSALRMLANLKRQGIEPQLLFWAYHREFELLQQLSQAKQSRQPLTKIFQQARVWQSKQAVYTQALNRISTQRLFDITQLLAKIDIEIKCDFHLSWENFSTLTLLFCIKDSPKALLI